MNSTYIKFGELLYERLILPKHIDIPSRQVTYWRGNKILPFFEIDQKHGKMNIPQAVWMLIINELTEIGVSSKRMAQLSKDVWLTPKKEKYADDLIAAHIKSETNILSDVEKDILQNQLSDEVLMNTLREELNPFTEIIKSSLFETNDPYCMVYVPSTGAHGFLNTNSETYLKLISNILEYPVIIMPILNKLLKILSYDFNSREGDLKYLSAIENQIRNIVLFKRPKMVEIAFDDNQIKPLVITEEQNRQYEIAEFFIQNKIPESTKLLIEVKSKSAYKLTLITK
jgi:hypothetical protein